MQPPFLDHNPRLGPTPEPFHRQTFVAKFPVKTLVQTVLPWLPRLNQRQIQILIFSKTPARLRYGRSQESGLIRRWFLDHPPCLFLLSVPARARMQIAHEIHGPLRGHVDAGVKNSASRNFPTTPQPIA